MNYQQKYLKYKKKYLNLKNQLGGDIRYGTIKAGTLLYRCAPSICDYKNAELSKANVRRCTDTGKIGIYFADRPIISLAMCIELQKIMEFGVFRVREDFGIALNKYSFREINPERFFSPNGDLILNVDPTPAENISHLKCEIQILNQNNKHLLPPHIQDGLSCIGSCEMFLTVKDLDKIEMIKSYKFNENITVTMFEKYFNDNHFPFYLQKYIEDNILVEFTCL